MLSPSLSIGCWSVARIWITGMDSALKSIKWIPKHINIWLLFFLIYMHSSWNRMIYESMKNLISQSWDIHDTCTLFINSTLSFIQ